MQQKLLLGLAAALLIAAPMVASAAPVHLTLTIEGVPESPPPDLSGPPPGLAYPASVYFGLGDCTPLPSAAANACNGDPPDPIVSTNNLALGNWRDWGYGLRVDQLILLGAMIPMDVDGTVVSFPDPLHQNQQAFWFVVGNTGGGSAGLDPDGPGVTTGFDLLPRNVTVSDGNGHSMTQQVNQSGSITVNWCCEDSLTIFASSFVQFDLSGWGLGLGTISVNLLGDGPVNEGDPDLPVRVDASAPVPPTIALFGLGLAGLAARRRKIA